MRKTDSISTLGLSVRANRVLRGHPFYAYCVCDLCRITPRQLLTAPLSGRKTLNEVRERLAAVGLSLADDPEPTAAGR